MGYNKTRTAGSGQRTGEGGRDHLRTEGERGKRRELERNTELLTRELLGRGQR